MMPRRSGRFRRSRRIRRLQRRGGVRQARQCRHQGERQSWRRSGGVARPEARTGQAAQAAQAGQAGQAGQTGQAGQAGQAGQTGQAGQAAQAARAGHIKAAQAGRAARSSDPGAVSFCRQWLSSQRSCPAKQRRAAQGPRGSRRYSQRRHWPGSGRRLRQSGRRHDAHLHVPLSPSPFHPHRLLEDSRTPRRRRQ